MVTQLKYSYWKLEAREPLYQNSAVILGWLQSKRAQTILIWFTVINISRKFFITIHVHGDFFYLKLSLRYRSKFWLNWSL